MWETGRKIEGKTGQRTELSNVRETGWKIEGKTGQRTELSNVRETALGNPFRRTLVQTGRGR